MYVSIPFTHLTRTQVAELLNKTPATIDRYCKEGKNVHGRTVYLKKHKGKFSTSEVLEFKKIISHQNQ